MTDKINSLVESLLTDLSRFQERLYKNEPLKFKSKRRYVCGLREVKKHLVLKHIKCVIIPPNMQRIQSPGKSTRREREREREIQHRSHAQFILHVKNLCTFPGLPMLMQSAEFA